MPPKTTARSYLSQEERRAQLLELGVELFSDKSYDEVSTDDIARHAGVSKGLMYHYFGNKRGFYTEVVRYSAEQMFEAVRGDDVRSPVENLRDGLREYFSFVRKQGKSYLAVINGGVGSDDTVREIVDESRARIADDILVKAGHVDSGGKLRSATRIWLGAVEAAAQDWLANEDVEIDFLIDELAVVLLAMLRMSCLATPGVEPEEDVEATALLMQMLAPPVA